MGNFVTNKLDSRAIGLDVGLAAVKFLTGKENLHYGIWDGLDVCAAHVGPAQEAYTDRLFALLPDKPLRILDIGGGAGETGRKLIALGHSVDIIIPSAYLAERCRQNAPEANVHECMMEDFTGSGPYDVCLFSESFQYIPMDYSLTTAISLLAPDGIIVVADCFRRDAYFTSDRSIRVGGGHSVTKFHEAIKTHALDTVSSEDVTVSVAPSVQVEQDFFNVMGLGLTRIDQELTAKKPFVRRIVRGFIGMVLSKRRRAKLANRLVGTDRSAANFERFNQYLLMVLKPK
jgi:MPBQ/MSBQ methyltransferase